MNQMSTHSSASLLARRSKASENLIFGIKFLMWISFFSSALALFLCLNNKDLFFTNDLFRLNGFVLLLWTTVSFFGGVVCHYASNYLKGEPYRLRFMILGLLFTATVMLLVISNNVFLFLGSWVAMGLLMSLMIGIDRSWDEAKQAGHLTRNYFLLGAVFLFVGMAPLIIISKAFTIDVIAAQMEMVPRWALVLSALGLITSAAIQSAMYPFHKWLLSAMTAPTPASALMHAGFVNGAGIMLALFAPVFFESRMLEVLFIVGGLTAIIAQFTKLLQVNVKHKLACSTIAQMGFMIMQCGLGFFNAAVAHLILHGFYKAYLFLNSGSEVKKSNPEELLKIHIKPLQALIVGIFGLAGAYLFNIWTGKGVVYDSSLFLTLIVAITVGQITYNIVKESSLTFTLKMFSLPIIFLAGIGLYALTYNGVTMAMSSMPMVAQPIPMSWIQIIFGLIFLLGFFFMKLGIYKKLPWLYVKLMNISQPHHKTVLTFKSAKR